jgi:hypothetical protein
MQFCCDTCVHLFIHEDGKVYNVFVVTTRQTVYPIEGGAFFQCSVDHSLRQLILRMLVTNLIKSFAGTGLVGTCFSVGAECARLVRISILSLKPDHYVFRKFRHEC